MKCHNGRNLQSIFLAQIICAGSYDPHRLLKERGGVEQGAITTQTDAEVDLVGQVVLGLVERHQLVLDVTKLWVPRQHGIAHDGGLNKDHHSLLVDEPLAEGDEGRDDHGVTHFLDDQHGERGLVPGEALRGWVLYRPEKIMSC